MPGAAQAAPCTAERSAQELTCPSSVTVEQRRETRDACAKRDATLAMQKAQALTKLLQEVGTAVYAGSAGATAKGAPSPGAAQPGAAPFASAQAGAGAPGSRVVDAEYKETH